MPILRALISVTDKTGLLPFARGLAELGVGILSTGGTARLLRDGGVNVVEVSDYTGFPEMMGGRVKTLHPKIVGGILGVRGNPAHVQEMEKHGILPIGLVAVNLYEFDKVAGKIGVTLEELIENIDIGGPTMIRAAAKNWHDVAVVTSPADYGAVLAEMQENGGTLSRSTLWMLARKAFALTAEYDRAITARLARIQVGGDGNVSDEPEETVVPSHLDISVPRIASLRYGENPHQKAAVYGTPGIGIAGARQLHGKELSFNNLVDADAAWQLAQEFPSPAIAIIKHTNPCGCAVAPTLANAYRRALECDPVSAFGGVVGCNRIVDGETAAEIAKLFTEVVVASGFAEEALDVLRKKKDIRLVQAQAAKPGLLVKSISGGYLVQTPDDQLLNNDNLRVVTEREPSQDEWEAFWMAWTCAKHVRSNAIVFARPCQLVAVGAGQMSRVDSVKLATMKAVLPLAGTVVGSDAFFPFPDGLEEAAEAGATAVIQPGGSVRDQAVIDAANRFGVAMVFTGYRHFRH